ERSAHGRHCSLISGWRPRGARPRTRTGGAICGTLAVTWRLRAPRHRKDARLPLPTLVLLGFASGIGAAIAARAELHESPHPAMLTRPLWAWVLFAGLVLIPVSAYFYVFLVDWFLLYRMYIAAVLSAIALLVFAAEGAIGALGLLAGASFVRSKKVDLAAALVALTTVMALAPIVQFRRELEVVGTYRQFHRGYGLTSFTETALYPGILFMAGVFFLGLVFLVLRLELGSRRAG